MLEHYPDACRRLRNNYLTLQLPNEGKILSPVDWGWLDEREREWWGTGGSPRKTQRQLRAEWEAKKKEEAAHNG